LSALAAAARSERADGDDGEQARETVEKCVHRRALPSVHKIDARSRRSLPARPCCVKKFSREGDALIRVISSREVTRVSIIGSTSIPLTSPAFAFASHVCSGGRHPPGNRRQVLRELQ
jgi:hypothetical protein